MALRCEIVTRTTISEFGKHSSEEHLAGILKALLTLDAKNTWADVFDITSVRGRSFRMPFNDKVVRDRKEGREVKPYAVLMRAWRARKFCMSHMPKVAMRLSHHSQSLHYLGPLGGQ